MTYQCSISEDPSCGCLRNCAKREWGDIPSVQDLETDYNGIETRFLGTTRTKYKMQPYNNIALRPPVPANSEDGQRGVCMT